MSGPKAILLSDCFSGFMFNTGTVLNSIKIEFYLGKILSKLNLCLLELSVGFFQTLLGIWTLAKNVILEVYFIDMKCVCLLLYLVFLLLFQPPRNCRSFGNFSYVLIMLPVNYFSLFFVGLQNIVFVRSEPWALACQMFRMYVKILHFVHKAVTGRSSNHKVTLLHLTCLVLSASSEGVRTTAAGERRLWGSISGWGWGKVTIKGYPDKWVWKQMPGHRCLQSAFVGFFTSVTFVQGCIASI